VSEVASGWQDSQKGINTMRTTVLCCKYTACLFEDYNALRIVNSIEL